MGMLGRAEPSDAELLSETIKARRSRTGMAFRGKGLKQLMETIENVPNSRLSILSNSGGFMLEGGMESVFQYEKSIFGTLVEWSMSIE